MSSGSAALVSMGDYRLSTKLLVFGQILLNVLRGLFIVPEAFQYKNLRSYI